MSSIPHTLSFLCFILCCLGERKTSIVSGLLQSTSGVVVDPAASESLSETRNSPQLGAGFMPYGRFGSTRIGKSVLAYIEFYAFGILTVAFLADLIVCARTSTVDLHLARNHKQYLAGVLAIFLTGTCLMTQTIFRMYYNRDFRVDLRLLLACLAQWMICAGCGGFLYGLTSSTILVSLFCFLPPAVYLGTYGSIEWYKNDFQIWVEPVTGPVAPGAGGRKRHEQPTQPTQPIQPTQPEEEKKDEVAVYIPSDSPSPAPPSAPQAPVKQATLRMQIKEIDIDLGQYSYLKRYKIAIAWLIAAVIIVGMGSTISVHSDPPYVGYSIMAVLLILCSTAIPMIEWFNSFAISKNMIVQLILTTACFIAFIVIFWVQGQNTHTSQHCNEQVHTHAPTPNSLLALSLPHAFLQVSMPRTAMSHSLSSSHSSSIRLSSYSSLHSSSGAMISGRCQHSSSRHLLHAAYSL